MFNVDFFKFEGGFEELLEGSWASLGTLWGPKWRPRAMESLMEDDFFFALVIFVSQIWIFINLGRFGEGFGKVLGVLGDFGGFLGRFLKVLGNTSLAFGNGSSHAFQNNHAAKMIKREQVAPLEACVVSLRAILIYNLSTF